MSWNIKYCATHYLYQPGLLMRSVTKNSWCLLTSRYFGSVSGQLMPLSVNRLRKETLGRFSFVVRGGQTAITGCARCWRVSGAEHGGSSRGPMLFYRYGQDKHWWILFRCFRRDIWTKVYAGCVDYTWII